MGIAVVTLGYRAPFIGRDREQAALKEYLATVPHGAGGCVLIAGEPGIGKTRLLRECVGHARALGGLALIGRADPSEGMPPYLPFVEAFGDYVRAQSPAQAPAYSAAAAAITLLVPGLRERPPGTSVAAEPHVDHGRYRLFEGVCDFLRSIAHSTPGVVLLGLDDLHWADTPTLLLLRHLARRVADMPLLIVGTYRSVETEQGDALRDLLAEFHREGRAEFMSLARFSADETQAFIVGATGSPAAPPVLAAIMREAAGNPFFAGEVVRHLVAQGCDLADTRTVAADWGIPAGVRQVIGARLARLSPETNRLLQAASLLGDGFPVALVGAVSGLDDGSLAEGCDAAVRAGMLHEEGDRYRFAHPLIRQTVYEAIGLVRRQRLHARAAEAMERLDAGGPAPHVAALATHYRLAGAAADAEKVVEYALRAAANAAAVFAWEEATLHLETALQRVPDEDCGRRCDLLLDLGDVLLAAGELRRVVDAVAPDALALAEGMGDDARVWRICRLARHAITRAGASAATDTHAYRAWIERMDRAAPPGTIARAYADCDLSLVRWGAGQEGDAWALSQHALRLSRSLGDREAAYTAAMHIIDTPWAPRHWAARLRLVEEVAGQSWAWLPPRRQCEWLSGCGRALLDAGARTRAEDLWRALDGLATRTRDRKDRSLSLVTDAVLALLDGRFADVLAAGTRLIEQTESSDAPIRGQQFASIVTMRPLLALGRGDEALGAILRARQTEDREIVGLAGVSGLFAGRYALCLAHLRRDAEARALLHRFLRAGGVGRAVEETDATTPALVYFLEAAALLRDREAADLLSAQLAGLADCATADMALTCVARHLGAAAVVRGDRAAARAYFRRALDVAGRVRYRAEVAQTHLQWAEALLAEAGVMNAATPRAEARAHLAAALPELRALGMQPALARARRAAARAGLRGDAEASGVPDGLTAREVDVLRLLAGGRTNRDMAATLFLSNRTIERHISNIYGKIGARGRADATAYALRHGLTLPGSG